MQVACLPLCWCNTLGCGGTCCFGKATGGTGRICKLVSGSALAKLTLHGFFSGNSPPHWGACPWNRAQNYALGFQKVTLKNQYRISSFLIFTLLFSFFLIPSQAPPALCHSPCPKSHKLQGLGKADSSTLQSSALAHRPVRPVQGAPHSLKGFTLLQTEVTTRAHLSPFSPVLSLP